MPVDVLAVEVADPTEPASVDALLSTLDAFRSWYPHDEICVSSIVVTWLNNPAYAGAYNARTGEIRISPDGDAPDLPEILRHELCHGADTTLDLSGPYAARFLEAEIPDGVPRRAFEGERFAHVCELGPRDHQRWRQFEQTCGQPYTLLPLAGLDLVRREVYREAPDLPWRTPTRPLTALPPIPLDDAGAQVDVSGAYVIEVDDSEVRWRDRETFSIVATTATPAKGNVDLVEGSPGPYLVALESGRLVWYEISLGALDPLPGCGDLAVGPVVEGVRWIVTMVGDAAELTGCDLHSGETFVEQAPEPIFDLEQEVERVTDALPVLAGATIGLWYPDAGLMWRDTDGRWDGLALPWYLSVADVDAAHDGSGDVLLTIQTPTHETERMTTAFAWVNTRDGTTETSPIPCLVGDDLLHPPDVSAGPGWFLVHDGSEGTLQPFTWSREAVGG